MHYDSIRPGQPWLDTNGNRIQAHAGSVLHEDGVFYWYGENKEHTTPGSGVWTYGIRAYRSTDLYNWDDLGLIIPPVLDDPTSALHPSALVDRPHIIRSPKTGKYVAWVKVMERDGAQRSTVLVADRFTGPYEVVQMDLLPCGFSAGDFDLVVDPVTGKGYYFFERVHDALICADLTDDFTDVTGTYTTHLELGGPPYVREAPAHFERNGTHYLITSGTSGYIPNPSLVITAPDYHGPWTVANDPHPNDASRTSYCSQVSSVFKHPAKRDLYIAVADRWLPHLPAACGDDMATGRISRRIAAATAQRFDPEGKWGDAQQSEDADLELPPALVAVLTDLDACDTSVADYVWLPVRFDGDTAYLDWHDEWRIEDYD